MDANRTVDFRLLCITDRHATGGRPLIEAVRDACGAGVRAVQLREKDVDTGVLYKSGVALRETIHDAGALFLINERGDLALACDADGVHCPEHGVPVAVVRRLIGDARLVGRSVHSLAAAREAEADGADYVIFGPVFETGSKAPQGLPALRAVCAEIELPVFAIGGIDAPRAAECREAGARGVAVISAIMRAPDVARAVREFEDALGGL